MIPGETICSGAAATCPECGTKPELEVLTSGGGRNVYIGTRCKCGPYTRESDYFPTREMAQGVLDSLPTKDPTKVGAMR